MPSIRNTSCTLKRRWNTIAESVLEEPTAKKRREDKNPDCWTPTSHFWDNLPKIWLTRRALDEFNRRNPQDRQQKEELVSHPPTLQRFARHGGPDLTVLRGFPDCTMRKSISQSSKRTASSKRTPSSQKSGPYDANYEAKLTQVGVILTRQRDDNNDIVMPTNHEEMMTKLNVRRPSLSPSRFTEKDFQNFQDEAERARTESSTMQRVMPIIEGHGAHYHSLCDVLFNNIAPLDPELAMAKPDKYDGSPSATIDHRVLHDLDDHIVPSTDLSRPTAPNFFVECKGQSGRTDVAKRQAAHNGAIGARAMMSLQSYPAQTPQYDGNAYSFSSTYHDGILRVYTTHATTPETPTDPPHYYMSQIKTFAMTDDSNTFRKGASHYRNARAMAKDYRDTFINKANQAAQQMPATKRNRSRTTTKTLSSMQTNSRTRAYETSPDTDTSIDELALDVTVKPSIR